MNTVLSLIIMIKQNSLKKDIDWIISQYIIEHIQKLQDITITKIADSCFTSSTTVIRFYKSLGFNNFRAFKSNLLTGVKTREIQIREKYGEIDNSHYVNVLKAMSLVSFDEKSLIDSINKCVDYIHENKVIHIYGAVFPLAITTSFIEDMALMGISIEVYQINFTIMYPSRTMH